LVDVFKSLVSNTRVLKIFAFSNNHYAWHGPATAKLFWDLWKNCAFERNFHLISSGLLSG